MKFFRLLPFYIHWHYTKGLSDYFTFGKNILWFIFNFFSIKALFQNFFTPFKRLKETYRGGLDIEKLAESIIVTTLMRIVGMIARSIIITVGLLIYVITFFLLIFSFFIWLALPLIILFLFIIVIYVLIKKQ